MSDFLESCRNLIGPSHVLTGSLVEGYLHEPRAKFNGAALAVLRPSSVEEVSALMALCARHGVAIVPQGGNTGLVGGQIPDASGKAVILSLARLKRVREIDTLSNTMIVEAGVSLQDAQEAAARAGRLFPLSLASQGSCTIGGNLATNAGGTGVIAYGNMRDLVLGLEVVLADGRVLHGLSKLKKDNTGYDLKHVFIGSEGTLGVISAAVLKLFPQPRSQSVAYVGLAEPEAALALLGIARERAGGDLTGFELMPRIGIDFVLKHQSGTRDVLAEHHDWYVLVEISSQQEGAEATLTEILEAAFEAGLAQDAALAQSSAQAADFWRLREAMSEVQAREGGSIKNDVSVPVARVADFIREGCTLVEALVPGARPVPFGHVGDGNIHFNISQPVDMEKSAFLAQWDRVTQGVNALVLELGGSFSAEHGIGQLKRDILAATKDPVALEVMRALKAALDPQGLMNPGKVL